MSLKLSSGKCKKLRFKQWKWIPAFAGIHRSDSSRVAEETKTPVLATYGKKDFRRFPHLKLIP